MKTQADILLNISENDRENLKKILKLFKRKKSDEEIFYDLCFCINAPQTTYKSNKIVIRRLIDNAFYHKHINISDLRKMVKEVRFLRKADYLQEAKSSFSTILKVAKNKISDMEKRDWYVKNVKGLGMKTASHFLRNLGSLDLAIIDTHILKILRKQQPKNRKEYLEYEKLFQKMASKSKMTVAELDSYIWKVLSGTTWEEFVF